jgi:hypothetical protein
VRAAEGSGRDLSYLSSRNLLGSIDKITNTSRTLGLQAKIMSEKMCHSFFDTEESFALGLDNLGDRIPL